ncbi:MAG: metallopeptidase family protein [Sciscionella sp.]
MAIELSRVRFEDLVADALDEIPSRFTAMMDNVVVLVEDANPEEPDLLGLYHGIALTERMSDYGGVLPDRITIYQQPIQRICETAEDVVREVAVTVVHEIGHHFGMDEATLHELGWG